MQHGNDSLPVAPSANHTWRRLRGPIVLIVLAFVGLIGLLGVTVIAVIKDRLSYRYYVMPSEGMEPTLMGHDLRNPATGEQKRDSVHDHFRCDVRAYRSSGPRYGDIIVFRAPKEADLAAKFQGLPQVENTQVKRVIGLPGDTILIKNGHVYRNNEKLEEIHNPPGKFVYSIKEPMLETLEPQFRFGTESSTGPVHLNRNQLWVMGDNRNDSNDSRYWGPLDRQRIIGKVVAITAPPERARTFP